MKLKPNKKSTGGFALIVTLSLMILLTVIAVGLLTLSSISLRTSSQSSDMATARSNARMALMLAVGELQKNAGLDTRVTARADLVDANASPVLGVWKSWEGTDHDATGLPKAPTYTDHKSARFLAWLTSASVGATMGNLPNTKAANGKVALLGEKSVGAIDPDKRQIHLEPTRVTSGNSHGTYAWWISGENQKARLPRPYAPATDNPATWSVLAKSYAPADPVPFGLDKLLKDTSLKDPAMMSIGAKAISLQQSNLLDPTTAVPNPQRSQEYYHDLSVNSVGLLTNTATGGWRKDLSLVADTYDTSLPSANLPFFRVLPERDLLYTRPSSNAVVAKSLLYPWSDYRRAAVSGNEAIYRFPPIGSWANLARYATLYKKFGATSASGSMSTGIQATAISGDVGSFIHNVRILPVIARVQWIYYHHTVFNATGANAGKYDVKLAVQPVLTLWNPYNVTITAPGKLSFRLIGSLPPVISYKICGVAQPLGVTLQDSAMTPAAKATTKGAFPGESTYVIENLQSLAPGETRVFSPKSASNTLEPGYSPYTAAKPYGTSATIATVSPAPTGGDNKITTDVAFISEFSDKGDGVGLYMNMDASMGTVLAYRMLYDKAKANEFYPPFPASKFPSPTLSEAMVPTPFLSVTFGARMASNTHLPSKGFVQSSPFVNYTAMGKKGPAEETITYSYPGVLHNVNSPFEFSFQGLQSIGDYIPDTDAKNHGFIMTGFKVSNGLSRCVIDELPGRPLASLAELQNWDARYENPVPPYSFNLVGNSDANPLFPSNAVVNAAEVNAKRAENLQNDDSYCLNHMLFDDWFFSSIAPEPTSFGAPSASSSAKTTYTNFLRDATKPLANRSYRAIQQDVAYAASSAANASTLATKNVGVIATSYKTIASRLEVEGMFNVNSTSVKAWRALLGHARNQKVPYIGSNSTPELSGETDYPFSRFSVAGDVEASKSGNSGTFAGNAQYAGYRVFTESQLDLLADEVVKQVRLRGPFLSLSEFVNRQLSQDNGLALAGAIQTALNKLADSSQNPYSVVQKDTTPATPGGVSGSNKSTANPPGGAPGDTGYKFGAAAVGYNLYGVPGWTRQADVLRPLAPILSARDDTFTIRAYGDARDATGKIVKARAVCEATIRRSREYVDSTDDTAVVDLSTSSGTLPTKRAANGLFGRRFEVISFRWLSQDEV
ncbi:MAG: pilus assembly PilX N-terminal domain-containing protein [Luteolibacter sp.]|uniref:pilus assembly PilX N-terminal domain-containing protein n=1 Tax=Luteolibacter sp. TaxID=1962973 RepID=UPI0032636D79